MATKKKRATARRSNAGRSAAGKRSYPRRARMMKRRAIRRNPSSIGGPKTWLVGGAGVLAGVFVTRGAPQLLLGEKNTGVMGYAANGLTAALAGWAVHSFSRNNVLTASVVAGGFAALIARIISDYTPYGSALALSGWGDYQFSNIVGTVPQRLIDPRRAVVEWGAPAPAAMAVSGGGTDMGVRGGAC